MSTLKLSIVQAELAWHDAEANRRAFGDRIDALRGTTDLIVLPEMFTTGFSMHAERLAERMNGESVSWLREQAAAVDAAVCGSLIVRDDDTYLNRFVFAHPDGSLDHYDKRHLFRLAGEDEHYAPGSERIVFNFRGFRICPQVCYDLRFPVWSRSRDDYDLLLYVANWPSARHFAWQTLIRARAIENLSYVAAVNRCGQDGNDLPYDGGSAIVDYLGASLADLGAEPGVATATLSLEDLARFRTRFAFQDDADAFTIDTESP